MSWMRMGSARMLKHLLGGLRGFETVEVVGCAADLWKLGNVDRPVGGREEVAVEAWLAFVGKELVPVLQQAVGAQAWIGFLWGDGKFSLGAHAKTLTTKDMARMGYSECCSWTTCQDLVQVGFKSRHPMFRILEQRSHC